jgi:hypothetical protein
MNFIFLLHGTFIFVMSEDLIDRSSVCEEVQDFANYKFYILASCCFITITPPGSDSSPKNFMLLVFRGLGNDGTSASK